MGLVEVMLAVVATSVKIRADEKRGRSHKIYRNILTSCRSAAPNVPPPPPPSGGDGVKDEDEEDGEVFPVTGNKKMSPPSPPATRHKRSCSESSKRGNIRETLQLLFLLNYVINSVCVCV